MAVALNRVHVKADITPPSSRERFDPERVQRRGACSCVKFRFDPVDAEFRQRNPFSPSRGVRFH